MFFIGVFGWGRRKKILSKVDFRCTGCIGNTFTLVEFYQSFDIFFMPIFKYSKEYMIMCDHCGSIYKIKEERIQKVLEEKKVEYEDVELIVFEMRTCPHCGTPITDRFSYCPKCGKSLE